MENKEEKSCCETEKSCCGGGCCCAKALIAVVLLLVGGIIGYLMGNCHGKKPWNCPMGGMTAPVVPPAK